MNYKFYLLTKKRAVRAGVGVHRQARGGLAAIVPQPRRPLRCPIRPDVRRYRHRSRSRSRSRRRRRPSAGRSLPVGCGWLPAVWKGVGLCVRLNGRGVHTVRRVGGREGGEPAAAARSGRRSGSWRATSHPSSRAVRHDLTRSASPALSTPPSLSGWLRRRCEARRGRGCGLAFRVIGHAYGGDGMDGRLSLTCSE